MLVEKRFDFSYILSQRKERTPQNGPSITWFLVLVNDGIGKVRGSVGFENPLPTQLWQSWLLALVWRSHIN